MEGFIHFTFNILTALLSILDDNGTKTTEVFKKETLKIIVKNNAETPCGGSNNHNVSDNKSVTTGRACWRLGRQAADGSLLTGSDLPDDEVAALGLGGGRLELHRRLR